MRKHLKKSIDQDEQDSYAEARTGSIICGFGSLLCRCSALVCLQFPFVGVRSFVDRVAEEAGPDMELRLDRAGLDLCNRDNWQMGSLIPEDSEQ